MLLLHIIDYVDVLLNPPNIINNVLFENYTNCLNYYF